MGGSPSGPRWNLGFSVEEARTIVGQALQLLEVANREIAEKPFEDSVNPHRLMRHDP